MRCPEGTQAACLVKGTNQHCHDCYYYHREGHFQNEHIGGIINGIAVAELSK